MGRTPVITPGTWAGAPQPTIEGALTLRPWRPTDVTFLAEAFADEAIERWHSFTDQDPTDWIADRSTRWGREIGADWAVERNGSTAGRIGLTRVDLAKGLAKVGYWVHPAFRGQGVASAALATVTAWAFGQGLHRIQLEHSVHNEASCRVAHRGGYALEGVARSSHLHADGWHDMHVHAAIGQS